MHYRSNSKILDGHQSVEQAGFQNRREDTSTFSAQKFLKKIVVSRIWKPLAFSSISYYPFIPPPTFLPPPNNTHRFCTNLTTGPGPIRGPTPSNINQLINISSGHGAWLKTVNKYHKYCKLIKSPICTFLHSTQILATHSKVKQTLKELFLRFSTTVDL